MKKLTCMLLLILALISCAAAGAYAADFETAVLEDGTLSITKYVGTSANVVIPETIDGTTVTDIGEEAFYDCTFITSVSFPNTITSIGYCAFEGCTGLTSLDLPDNLIYLRGYAFDDCDSLTSVEIPASVDTIGDNPFAYCDNLAEITVAEGGSWLTVGNGFLLANGTHLISAPGRLPSHITVPEGVSVINSNAFSGCSGMQTIDLPATVTEIDSYAFWGCPDLLHVTLPDSVTTIGTRAFYGCINLSTVTLPETLSMINEEVFNYCDNLTLVVKSGSYAEAYALEYGIAYTTEAMPAAQPAPAAVSTDAFETTVLEDGTISITKYIGSDTDVIIPESIGGVTVTAIGDEAFIGCTSITSVTFPETIVDIGWCAFDGCVNLQSLTLPSGLVTLSGYAFSDCDQLTSVHLPATIDSLGDNPFAYCDNLTTITVENGSEWLSVQDNILLASASEVWLVSAPSKLPAHVSIPAQVTVIDANAFSGCSGMQTITLPDVLTEIDNYAFFNCDDLQNVSIPESVTRIGTSAFEKCDVLAFISIPESVTEIGEEAFLECPNLTLLVKSGSYAETYAIENGVAYSTRSTGTSEASFETSENEDGTLTITKYVGSDTDVVIPETIGGKTVTIIGEEAFMDCTALTTVTFPNTIVTIDTSAFEGCTSLDNVVLPDSLIELNSFAFDDCDSLTRIEIPAALDSIGSNPFSYCDKLQEITVAPGCEWIEVIDGMLIVNGERVISAIHNLPSHVVVPEGIDTIRGNAFSGCEGMQTLSFPSSLTEFNGFVFWGCPDLTEVIIPDSVTTMGNKVFYGCDSLTSVTVPASVTTMGNEVFGDCPNLTLLVESGSYAETYAIENGVAYSAASTGAASFETSENEDGTLSITKYTGGDSNVVIPETIGGKTVTVIEEEAFMDCTFITTVTFPDSITIIGTSAFEGCTSLRDVTLPRKLDTLRGFAFDDCDSLTSIMIPASLNTIGSNPFAYCDKLQEITVENGCEWIEVIDGMLIVNDERVISAVSSLPSHVVVPNGIDTIRGNAFSGCSGMKTIEIPNSVVELSGYAFWGCPDLETVVIPDSVTTMGNKVFYNCNSLKSVTVPASVTTMGESVFGDCPNLTLQVASGSYAETYAKENGVKYQTASAAPAAAPVDLSAFEIKYGTLTKYTRKESDVVIPHNAGEPIYIIGDTAFEKNSALMSVVIEDGIEEIGTRSFAYCSNLREVTVPSSVTSIGPWAFDRCTRLTLIVEEGSYAHTYAQKNKIKFRLAN